MEKAVGIGEHGDILETIEKELKVIAEYHDQLEVLEKYIKRD
jgi:predicted ribonuclease toxin of YeeF-YezG toxin-antitoxin module